ncbi:hypothetical protein K491DRAFT_691871 [Lophiostoma macrostomum CBS 122681]|uniref:Uncharacterized protein n=1 Tax=Lophiostoma macrostomum CBS 122681 TaxID=1314788 RepID=A0A6A6TDG0_9PLEO|nr:hypothetical protein K491DRAFT_691871 [Lophiostoma macrostomum CBS 122681]
MRNSYLFVLCPSEVERVYQVSFIWPLQLYSSTLIRNTPRTVIFEPARACQTSDGRICIHGYLSCQAMNEGSIALRSAPVVWFCCHCGDGPHGSTIVDRCCCDHHRCADCSTQTTDCALQPLENQQMLP